MARVIDLTGKRFGKLVVVKRGAGNPRKDRKGESITTWICRCDCGNQTEVTGQALKHGTTKSCGCYKREKEIERNTLPDNKAAKGRIFRKYIKKAQARGYPFQLTEEQFFPLLEQPCFYCGALPDNKGKHGYKYQGIDRTDNSKGYVPGNVVPCCINCNRAKGNRTLTEFISWTKSLFLHNR